MIPASTILTVVVESAVRSLLLAACVGAGLLLLRTRNVPARKAAWMLVLAASFAMPVLARWAADASWIPQSAAFVVSTSPWHSSRPDIASGDSPFLAPSPDLLNAAPPSQPAASSSAASHFPAPAITTDSIHSPAAAATPSRHFAPSAGLLLLVLYLAVVGALLARIGLGTWAAARLWATATPVNQEASAPDLRVRASSRIASPVTIGSGIVLPASYTDWDREKLRIVLAHEACHVRQGDFYLQLCASLYAAIFWFSPLGWWLKRILSDLGETISDRAALQHAASHASYAQVLLEFAALPRPVATGVAMAHHGRIVPRIERLLNESSFRQAFIGTRARIAAAVLLVFAGVFGATALVRVQAAQTPHTAPAPDSTVPPAQASPAVSAPQVPSSAAPAQAAPTAPSEAVPPPPSDDDQAPALAPPPPAAPVVILPRTGSAPYVLSVPKARILAEQAKALALLQAQKGKLLPFDRQNFYRFGFGNDGNSYAYVTGQGDKNIHFSGNWYAASRAQVEKARQVAHGDFIWFERDGKSYVIDDPAMLASLKPMQDQMDALGQKQEALGKQQEELGKQQEALGKQMEQIKVPTPDMKKEMEKLHTVEAKLAAIEGKSATQEELASLESQLAEVQSKLGDLQGNMGGQMGDFGEKMGELGSQQGKLGAEQGRLGAEQGRIAREMDGKVLTIIDESLKNGKARLVQ